MPYVSSDATSVSLKSANQDLSVKILTNYGKPFPGVKSVKASVTSVDGAKAAKEVAAKLNKENTQGSISL